MHLLEKFPLTEKIITAPHLEIKRPECLKYNMFLMFFCVSTIVIIIIIDNNKCFINKIDTIKTFMEHGFDQHCCEIQRLKTDVLKVYFKLRGCDLQYMYHSFLYWLLPKQYIIMVI